MHPLERCSRATQSGSRLAGVIWLLLLFSTASGETPPEQQEAIKSIQGFASNVQKNRDGTVRFVRFSKPVVTDEHVAYVAAFEQLDYLAVVTPNVTDEGIRHVAGLTNLDTLFLSDSGLTDAGMPALESLSKLERLYLDRTGVTDEGLKSIAGLQTLTTVSLAELDVSDAGLAALTGLTSLDALRLRGTKLTDAGLERLAQLTNLRALDLSNTNLAGSGLSHLSELALLESLDLSGTAVTPDVLATLDALPKLRLVNLYHVDISEAAAVAVLPSVAQVRLSPPPGEERDAWQRFLDGDPLAVAASDAGGRDDPAPLETPVLPPMSERIAGADVEPDFQQHVVPLLGRLGCNGRTCHGSFQGQGGFRLSMFGYDFEADIEALAGGDEPRVNLEDPEQSLVLLKPTMQEDHDGGLRFETGSWEYQMLRRWIERGAEGAVNEPRKLLRVDVTPSEVVFSRPSEAVQLQCVAVWSDGSREDVTCLSRFESNDEDVATVTRDGLIECNSPGDTHIVVYYDNSVVATPVMLAVSELAGESFPDVPTPTRIDELVVEKLSKLGIVPSELSTDEEFLRRVSLDIHGTLPTPGEVREFVADESPDKRTRKIDELLETPAYVEWWTMKLADLTGCNSQHLGTTDMNSPAAGQWAAWLRRRVKDNVGWDEIAAGLILATSRSPGETYSEYAARHSQYLRRQEPEDFTAHDNSMHYYWFRSNNQVPSDRALSFGYIFLGVRLECAQCHKHPFDQWSKQDFEQFTQFFTRIKAGVSPEAREEQMQLKHKLGVPVKLDTAALRRQMYMRVAAEGLPIPWNEIWIQPPGENPQIAKLLGDEAFDLNEYADPREPLAAWLLSEENPYFARAMVNRVWAHYFGVGIVDPPDDMNLANPPSNGPLLDWLSREFAANGYDFKWLHRTITGSRTYQLSWRTNDTNRSDARNFSHAQIRRLPAEVTIDAILQATVSDAKMATWASNVNQRKIAHHPRSIMANSLEYPLLIFGKPLRNANCDCERQSQPTLLQSLYVRNDEELLTWLTRADGWLTQAAKQEPADADADPTEQIDELIDQAYLRTVSRLPEESERQRSRRHLREATTIPDGMQDLLWALLNTQEFLTNH